MGAVAGAPAPVTVRDLVARPHHTALCVEDFDAAQRLFVEVFGFEVEGAMDGRSEPGLSRVVGLPDALIRWAMLVHGGYRIELFKYYRPAGGRSEIRQCDSGYTHIALEVTDVDAAYRRLVDAGYATMSAPELLRGGRTKAVYLRAPERNVVELIQFLPTPSTPTPA